MVSTDGPAANQLPLPAATVGCVPATSKNVYESVMVLTEAGSAVVRLYRDKAWNFPDRKRRDGFSVVLFGAKGPRYRHPPASLVQQVQALDAPYPTKVGGFTALFVDQRASLAAHLPWAALVIVAVTLVALFVMTGSVLLVLKPPLSRAIFAAFDAAATTDGSSIAIGIR